MKLFRTTSSFAALAATFVVGAPVLARPAINSSNASQMEDESPTPTLITSGDVAPSSWAITQKLDVWAALTGIEVSTRSVLQRMDTPNAPARDEQNMAVRRVTSASQSPSVRQTVEQTVPSTALDPLARTSVVPDVVTPNANPEGSSSPQTNALSATPLTTSPVAVAPIPSGSASAVAATSTRTAGVSEGRTPQRPNAAASNAAGSNAVIAPKAAVVSPSPKKVDGTKAPLVKAPSHRDPAQLSARHKDRILLARLEADLMRANRGLDRANDTLSEGQKQLMKVGTTLRSAMLEAGPDAKGLHPFVRVAMRYAGTPYVWGGESRNGFDCSGFIIVVMRDLGYRALPHSAAEQFNYGTPIAQQLLKPGDIVFFKNTYKRGVSHVGIYLGNRRYIEAAGTGKGTIVSSLDSAHAQAHYAGARRLIRS